MSSGRGTAGDTNSANGADDSGAEAADGLANGGDFILRAPGCAVPDWLFEPTRLRAAGRLLSDNALGRGTAWLFAHDAGDGNRGEYVLRHYRRGGLAAKLSTDRYLWLGLQRCRAMREFSLLLQLAELGLPVPRPLAARVQRRGCSYRNDLITARIADARTLAERLCQAALPAALWARIGATIRRFHDAGIHHADLNANNILIDADGGCWLIDFDRGDWRAGRRWKAANLARLRRSLDKLADQHRQLHFCEPGWAALLAGYRA